MQNNKNQFESNTATTRSIIQSYAGILEAIRSMNAGDELNAIKAMVQVTRTVITE